MKRLDISENLLSYHENVLTLVIITIKECYQTHVLNVFVIIDTKHVNFRRTRQIKKTIVYV